MNKSMTGVKILFILLMLFVVTGTAQALEFADFLNKTFDNMQTRCKTAKTQRGDETANLELFITAKAAFFAKWNAAK